MKKNKNQYVYLRHQRFVSFLNFLFGSFVRFFSFYSSKRPKVKMYEPFLLISNHVTHIDPLLLTSTLNRQIYYLASELIFSRHFPSRLLEYCFAPIAKTKGQHDLVSIKKMMQVIKEGGNVGIFIEGNTTINGAPSYVASGIGKLAKLIKRPIIIFNFHNGYLTNPRWSTHRRQCAKRTGNIKEILLYEDYKNLSSEELEHYLIKSIDVNAYEEKEQKKFLGKRNAEGLHRLLFMCPECLSHNTLVAKKNHLSCTKCSFRATFDEYGYLKSNSFKTPQNTIILDENNKLAYQNYIIKKKDFKLTEEGYFSEIFVRSRKNFGKAKISLSLEGLFITFKKRKYENVFYNFHEIDSMVMHRKDVLVIYLKDKPTKALRIHQQKQTSAYQFVLALEILQNIYHYQDNLENFKPLCTSEMGLK